ncbi:MAG TPA: YCF48-related protein [Pyrinomonadaceae bacterium]|jgi:photosystem II stability/assembly factor-like uncharacterized protein
MNIKRIKGFSFLLATVYGLLATAFVAQGAGVWTRQNSGTMAWLHAVYFLDENRGWAVGGNGALLATTDGGETWKALRRPSEDTLRDLYFFDEQTGWLVCERSVYLLKTKDEPRTYLMKTTDNGSTWKRVNVVGSHVDARLVRALFTIRGRAWAFGEAGALFTTHDGGTSWTRQRVPTRHLLLGGDFITADKGWLVGAGATILQTSDGGETWRASSLNDAQGVRFNAASFVEPRIGWAVGSAGRVFATIDGGRTWQAQKSGTSADLLDVKFLDASEGWAVGAKGTVIHTTDSGLHWQTVPSDTTHPLERLCFVSRERGWAVGFGGTIISYAPAASTPKKAPELKGQK